MTKIGWRNSLESILLTRFGVLWKLVQRVPLLRRMINRFLLNRAIMRTKTRPHQFSLMSSYTSWDSLTNRKYTGRHLSEADEAWQSKLPPLDSVEKLFVRTPNHWPSGVYSKKSTVLFSNFAQWFTDGFLRTARDKNDPDAFRRNTSNHEIDLCQVYGLNTEQTNQLRSGSGGKLKCSILNGHTFPPTYFDDQGNPKPEFSSVVPILPPRIQEEEKRRKYVFVGGVERLNIQIGYAMMNALFIREHNRICDELKVAYSDWNDERLFQTARNVLIVVLLRVVVEEYINHITPYHFQFFVSPSPTEKSEWYRTNWMTVEFNLLYRWHSMVPDSFLVGQEYVPMELTLFNNQILVSRGLLASFRDASSQPAAEVGLFNTHPQLLHTERASLELGRKSRLRSYNEYRVLFGYPPAETWSDISDRKAVQDALRDLYKTPDNVELFVGLFAEDVRERSALSPLIGRMVGVDAFSQALTNPLLSANVYNEQTFSKVGLRIIESTNRLGQLLQRNAEGEELGGDIHMSQNGTEVPPPAAVSSMNVRVPNARGLGLESVQVSDDTELFHYK